MWVVKIGGSLEAAPGLRALLALLVEYGRAKTVIVPGGGRFADRVRTSQVALNLDDPAAHALAIQAMEQYAGVLCSLDARLCPIAAVDELGNVNMASALPVWLPGKLLSAQPGIPASWQVTSDSLALWFAGEISATALVLVKSVANETPDIKRLCATGYLDEYFPQMMARTNVETLACVSIDNLAILQQALVSGIIPPAIRLV